MTTTERILSQRQSFMYEPTCPPTIPPGMTVQEFRRTRARAAVPPRSGLLGLRRRPRR